MSMSGQGTTLPSPPQPVPLLNWLLTSLPDLNRTRIKQILRSGRVLLNGVVVTRHDHPVTPQDSLLISVRHSSRAQPAAEPFPIVYQNDRIVVIDKPAGLLTVATEGEKLLTAFVQLREYLARRQEGRPYVVHRLDRETSGLVLFARTPEAKEQLQRQWTLVSKTYLAIIEGTLPESEGVVENFLIEGRDLRVRIARGPRAAAKHAVSRFRVRTRLGGYSLVEVGIETGRKHQIRVHMAGLGCPVAGDRIYGARTDPARRLALHAWRLAISPDHAGCRVELESQLPEALRAVLS